MLTLVTVNYQDPKHTLRLIDDLNQQTTKKFALIIIDNNSSPQHQQALQASIEKTLFSCALILQQENTGFAGGTNRGLKESQARGADWILILNNDTRVDSRFIHDLQRQLKVRGPGLYGLPIMEHGERITYGILSWFSTHTTHTDQPRTPNSYIIGAALLIDTRTLTQLGYLDERYFLYFEDAEYSFRARARHITVQTLPSPSITHLPSQSTSKLPRELLLRYHMRNAILLHRTHAPWWVQLLVPLWCVSILAWNVVKYSCIPLQRPQARSLMLGVLDAYRNQYGIIT